MYVVGASHPNKAVAERLLQASIIDGERLVTDVEVLQEILHRSVAIRRRDAIQPAFDALSEIVDEIFQIERADVEAAKVLVLTSRRLSARDALHLAVMQRRGVHRIMSFDAGFDGLPGIIRVGG